MWTPLRVLLNGMMSLASGDVSITQAHTLKNAWLGLLASPVAPTTDMDTTTLTAAAANYQGYARQQLMTWNGPYRGQGNFSLVSDDNHVFQPTGSDSPNLIYGQVLIGADSVTFLAVEMFNTPISLASPLDAMNSVVIFGLGPNAAGYGSSIVS